MVINKKDIIIRILLLALIILILLAVISILKLLEKREETEEEIVDVKVMISADEIQENAESEEIEKLKKMTERNRIEYYITKFINYTEGGEYEKAYNLLNREYRNNYFPTKNEFEEYSKNTFTKMLNVEYTNFERNGNIYVSWVTLTDTINGNRDSGKEFNFVIKENNYNDFELSFSKN